ncbi:hypothetical protein V8F20_008620 [Naviculisporaceae sp. PSN 640]
MAAPFDTMDVEMSIKEEPMDVYIKMEEDTLDEVNMADIPAMAATGPAIKMENDDTINLALIPRVIQLSNGTGAPASIKQEDVAMTDGVRAAPPSAEGAAEAVLRDFMHKSDRAAQRLRIKLRKQIGQLKTKQLLAKEAEDLDKLGLAKRRRSKMRKYIAQLQAEKPELAETGLVPAKKLRMKASAVACSGGRVNKKNMNTWRKSKSAEYQGEINLTGYGRGKRRTKFMRAMESRGNARVSTANAGNQLETDFMDCFKAWNLGSNQEDKQKGKEVAPVPGRVGQENMKPSHGQGAADITNMLGAMKLGGGHSTVTE